MSRATNKLKSRLRAMEHEVRRAKEAAKSSAADVARFDAALKQEAVWTIKVANLPAGLLRHGKRFRIEFVVDAFECDFLRRGGMGSCQNVTAYARMMGQEVAHKVARVIEDQLLGKKFVPK